MRKDINKIINSACRGKCLGRLCAVINSYLVFGLKMIYNSQRYFLSRFGIKATFCSSNLNYSNYEIVINENTRIVNQASNVYDDAVFSKLYMKCFPEYSGDNESITSDVTDEETSMLSWYFMKKLKEL